MIALRERLGRYRADVIALCVVIAGALITVLLPLTFPHNGGPTGVDDALADPIHSAVDGHLGVYRALVIPSNGYILIPLLFTAAAWFGYRGWWRRAAAMVVIPEVAVGINSWVLKPLWDRPLHDYLAYPSGHTVHLVAIATAFVLLIDSTRARVRTAVLAMAALLCAATGMIGLGYHLPTDLLGGAAAAVAMVTALCRLTGHLLEPTQRAARVHSG